MNAWLRSLRIYREKRLVAILLMGFSSGLPLPLTFATLSFWLSEAGVSRTAIGLFVLVGFSYNYKFLWSPVLDHVPIPWATRRLGRRRSWALLIQALLLVTIVLLGRTDPRADLATTAMLAALVAFLSASQDIVIDAFRIELLRPEEQGAGAAATQWGYRFGLLAAGAGALYAAQFGGWGFAYAVMAALMGIGMVTVLLTREPVVAEALPRTARGGIAARLREAVLLPFADLVRRKGWLAVLLFIVLYKLGEAMAGSMANPLYQQLGFSKIEVANIAKLVGFAATLGGVAFGGGVVARRGLLQALLLGGVLQMLSNLMYVAQVLAGHSNAMLALSIFTENFTNGMGSAAFVAYLSSLCSLAFTATQYALFSSLAALPTRLLSAPSGWLVDQLDWIPFFLLTTAAAVPGILMLFWLIKRERLIPSPLGVAAQP
ncbi:MAG: major facilitator superfamily 1 [Rhodospirillales bacterium]|nr:major facilitator superfamily 1 [Rhodospirillales bacterium]